jgi:anti-anti-sigma factor
MRITREHDGDTVRIALTGELDLATGDAVREQLERDFAAVRPSLVLVDMAEVSFCDSSGIEALICARNAAIAQGTVLRLVNVRGIARTTLEITGVLPLLTREPGAGRT